jgi:hypothetical protein
MEAQRAYFASQLGKYIPGKAWVILIRCALINNQTTTAPVVIASTFYETLAMMAAGSLLAPSCPAVRGNARPEMLVLAGRTGSWLVCGAAACVWPPDNLDGESFQKSGHYSHRGHHLYYVVPRVQLLHSRMDGGE